jgi:hypothetical protein
MLRLSMPQQDLNIYYLCQVRPKALDHSVHDITLDRGKVYGCGSTSYSQLADAKPSTWKTIEQIKSLDNKNIALIESGHYHSM